MKSQPCFARVGLLLCCLTLIRCGSPGSSGTLDAGSTTEDTTDVSDTETDAPGDTVGIPDVQDTFTADTGDGATDTSDTDAESDAGGSIGTPCEGDIDCTSLECIDLAVGDAPGICSEICALDEDCPEGFDCVLIASSGTDAERKCIPVDYCADADGDRFGIGPGCLGIDCNDNDPAVNLAADEICDGIDNDCDEETDENSVDVGSDCVTGFQGVCASGRDTCVEGNVQCVAVASPTEEVCDGLDNDCDGEIDNDPTDLSTWYPDADGDRFGSTTGALQSCSAPVGYLPDAGDCDDTRATSNPSATELCDGFDNDCDGDIDEALLLTWYRDADGDRFGTETDTVQACTAPEGYVAAAGDCDDTRANSNSAATELCDGFDNDCDGDIDESVRLSWYRDADGDRFGNDADTVAACAAPEGYVSAGGDCDDARIDANPSATELCDGIDNDCDGSTDEDGRTPWYRDADADGFGNAGDSVLQCGAPDGYVSNDDDCNDENADISPAAAERCNGVDDNCDGSVDEPTAVDAPTWFIDGDDDTFGSVTATERACTQPAGYVASATDCDDTRSDVNPLATEVCNLRDDDCNGSIDEPSATDATTWYLDGDRDTFGDPGTSLVACTPPAGYVANNTDCDDTRALSFPGGTELCNGFDDNCDGTADEDTAVDADIWYADGDDDLFGDNDTTAISCVAPAGYVADNSDCDDLNGLINPIADEVCDSIDNNCNGSVDEPSAIDASVWYADADTDTFGNPASSQRACEQPAGFVANALDCRDDLAAVNPAATEVCNSRDDDCDLAIDENDAADAATWYFDGDSDTWGSATTTRSCVAPANYVNRTGDCNDGNSAINPAATETCNGIDDNCAGGIDEGSPANASNWYRDADSDSFGNAADLLRRCAQPSGYVSNASDCNDGNSGIRPGAPEVCDNIDANCNGLGDEPYTAWYVDSDGDGVGAGGAIFACSNPGGRVTGGNDCDDSNFRRTPGRAEICDGLDNNCDGTFTAIDRRGRIVEYDASCQNFGGGNSNDLCFGESWNGQGYMHCHYHQSFDSARGVCGARGMDLADINSGDENANVIGAFNAQDGESWDDLWIGGRENGTSRNFLWVRTGAGLGYTNWRSGEPSNDSGGGNDDCIAVRQSGFNWNDRNCGGNIEFICEW
jgi:hypothetical protein